MQINDERETLNKPARYDEEVDLDDLTDDELDFDAIEMIADTVGISDDNFGEDDY